MNYKSSVDRAKSYVNNFLKRSDKSSNVIVDEKIWQINKKYIAVQISPDILIINQHRAHFKILYDQFLESINGKPLGGQTLLFPEKIELNFDLKSTLMAVNPYARPLVGYGFYVHLAGNIRLFTNKANRFTI